MNYKEKLLDPRWQKKRLHILERDSWACTLCGDNTTTLHVHHKSYSGDPWDADNSKLTTLCASCHTMVELVNNGSLDNAKMLVYGDNRSVRILLAEDRMAICYDETFLLVKERLDELLGELRDYYFNGDNKDG